MTAAPPAARLTRFSPATSSLPVPLTTLVGREREAAAVRELLRASRLVTVTGAGGSGKTRLALEVARLAAPDFAHGAAWAELAPLADPELLPGYLVAVLGLEATARPPADTLLDALRDREMLLALDNCEHVVDACAQLVDRLLRGCPGLRILATSREALGVGGERAWLIPALSLPVPGSPADDAAASEAVRLFVERAAEADAAFRLTGENLPAVAEICRRLDGLPLAIELAAARVRALTPAKIAERLGDSFRLLAGGGRTGLPRHRTLRGAIEWSHSLLSEEERVLFRRLSVFVSGFTLEAAEAVCADDASSLDEEARSGARSEGGAGGAALGTDDVLDVLAALVDKSLVVMESRAGEARYRLLEVMRQYAAEQLREAGEEEERRAPHAAFHLALAEQAEPNFFGFGAGAEWSARLDEEMPNFRAAADWLAAAPERAEGALRLMRALYWHFFARGYFAEGRQRLLAGLAHIEHVSPLVRAKALTALGFLTFSQGERTGIREPMEESVALLRTLDDPRSLGYALIGLGVATWFEGDTGRARATIEEAVEVARAAGERVLTVLALYWRGSIALGNQDLALARSSLEEAVRIARAVGGRLMLSHTITRLGLLLHLVDDDEAALACFREALGVHREARDRWGSVQLLEGFAGVAVARGQPARGARLLGASDAVCRAMGVPLRADLEVLHGRTRYRARLALGEAAYDSEHAAGLALALEQAMELADATPASAPAPSAPPKDATAASATPAAPAPSAAPATAPASAPALRVLALGPLEMYRDGERLPDDAWRSARPRELLLYLLCHPEGRTREQIGLVFWPDASATQVKNNFHVTLHHLRKSLGRGDLVAFDDEHYRVAWDAGVEFDALLFEREVKDALRRPAGDAAATDVLKAALARYRGELLADERVGDWHLDTRDRLARLFAEGTRALGQRLERAERHAEAAEAYRRLVAADSMDEEAHRRLMVALARAGERGQALRQYERLVVLLRAELEAEPEPETTALHERLKRAEAV